MKKKYGPRDMNRKQRQAELSFMFATLRIDLYYNPVKYHLNVSNGCGVMLRKPIVDARPAADVHHFNNQSFPLENLVKNLNPSFVAILQKYHERGLSHRSIYEHA